MPWVMLGTGTALAFVLLAYRLVGAGAQRRWNRNSRHASSAVGSVTWPEVSAQRFDPYMGIEWDDPGLAVTPDDLRWMLTDIDPLGSHPWYRAQSQQQQIAIGMWRQANIAKAAVHLDGVVVQGLVQCVAFIPNGSPRYRYFMQEALEDCNHALMFQELVNRTGIDVPGIPRWMRLISTVVPVLAGQLPGVFFFWVLSSEVSITYLHDSLLHEDAHTHPVAKRAMAIRAEAASRHITFTCEYLRCHVPGLHRASRLLLSLYVPVAMWVLHRAVVVVPRRVAAEFSMPNSVRREVNRRHTSRPSPQDPFAGTRTLCEQVGLMNPFAQALWRIFLANRRVLCTPRRQ